MLATNNDIAELYKLALKEATRLYTNGAALFNKAQQDDPHELLQTRGELVDTSCLKKGPSVSLPPVLLELIYAHVSMSQLSGNGECKPRKVMGLIGAAIANTEYYSKFSVLYVYRNLRERFADTVQESKVMNVEDCCMNWTTYPNLNIWFDGTKAELIHYGYVEDTPQPVRDIFAGKPMPFDVPGKDFNVFANCCILT